ncbi:glycosyltransferase family 4 protein [Salipiger abyssi]|uniref:glycosyltransferase family 4 protein n=1 Tax=Salipiger abyssi TaxID=1250539 RepID=UPI001A8D7E54|nr:glycosyltransferase [Salipiger abyssi]MBN9889832.1 glycosyltransferase family 4 protein [Salipiger abyssi]
MNVIPVPSLAKKGEKYKKFNFGYYDKYPALRQYFNVPVWHGFQEYLKRDLGVFLFTFLGHLYLAPEVNKRLTVIDTNDLNSIRASIFNYVKRPIPINIQYIPEMEVLNLTDLVVAIQEDEYVMSAAALPAHKVVYVPHSARAQVSHKPIEEADDSAPLKVLFPASHQHPNIDGLNWFLNNVWPYLPSEKFTLEICGSICDSPEIKKSTSQGRWENIAFLGRVDDLDAKYKEADIVINPCPYGSGMKIKSVEAMSFGCPLVTTSPGGEGLRAGENKAFLVADTAADFVLAMITLLDKGNRSTLSDRGLKFISDYFLDGYPTRIFLDRLYAEHQSKPGKID